MKRMLGRIRLRRMDVIALGPAGADLGNFLSGFTAFSATFSRRTIARIVIPTSTKRTPARTRSPLSELTKALRRVRRAGAESAW